MTIKEYKHEWYLKNRERLLENHKHYRAGNIEKIKHAAKKYHDKNKAKKEYYDKRRNLRYIEKFGITLDEYEQLLATQNSVCAICQNPPKRFRLAVDHDHKTGRIRGLLCFRCNYGLGWLGDNWEKIQRVYQYFYKHYNE